MLTTTEKILFLLFAFVIFLFVIRAIQRIIKTIARGQGRPNWSNIPKRLPKIFFKILALLPVFQVRRGVSIIHGLIAWGFLYYLLVNLSDLLRGFIPNLTFLGRGTIGDIYRLASDFFTVAIWLAMAAMLLRRFLFKSRSFDIQQNTLLFEGARAGIKRDSLMVGVFVLFHVGSRLLGESFHLAMTGLDRWQPVASGIASLVSGLNPQILEIGRHLGWWFSIGSIFLFLPYFLYSKHLHLFVAPLNSLLQPERRSIGELRPLDFEDQQIEQFGAQRLEQLPWNSIMDAYACIMCNRCQDVCPAYQTGKVLSPSALEINKRYFINQAGSKLSSGVESTQSLLEFAILSEAIWACTTCGACVKVCPVANEPLQDIVEIRRHLVLMENNFPEQLQAAYRGMERASNPWNIPQGERLGWAQGLKVPTIQENPDPDILWWVGCAPATDPRAQKTARAFAQLLQATEVNFAVLGEEEHCTGDAARRSGNEYLFYEMALSNIDTLNRVKPSRIVTTCPHCLHTLKNEYPAYGGEFDVIHHTQLLQELFMQGRLRMKEDVIPHSVTFHDPCYLGRHNGIVGEPRNVINGLGLALKEMDRKGSNSFCCGAGGGQMWKEEEAGDERVSANRLAEAERTGVEELIVSCPFCMIMLSDAITTSGSKLQIRDVVEIAAERVLEE